MTDLAAITALVHAYARLLDDGDLDGIARLFEHATWRSTATGEVYRGTDEVRRVYDRVQLYDGSPRTAHLITNLDVTLDDGARTAAAHCCFTVLHGIVPGEPVEVILTGTYEDRFEKVAGRWRFADRLFAVRLSGDLRTHFA
jgi:3-phenylpropionate/cinnamic acid dioxygenase small subunit